MFLSNRCSSNYERLPTTKQKILVCSESISAPPVFQMMLWQMTGSPASFGIGLPSGPLTMRCSSIGTQSISTQSRRPLDDPTGMPSRAHQRPSDRSSASVAWQSFFEQQLTSPGLLRPPYQASRSGRLRSWLWAGKVQSANKRQARMLGAVLHMCQSRSLELRQSPDGAEI
jgi:hypothetical protein